MWKALSPIVSSTRRLANTLLSTENLVQQQIRTTYVFKRKFAPFLHKKKGKPKTLRSRHYIYEVVKETHAEKQPDIEVILLSHLEGVGHAGDKVSVRPNFAYNNLLLPGLAIYASPENLEKYKDTIQNNEEVRYSSVNAPLTMKIMSRMELSVVMNRENPWTLQPWHVSASFRKCGYIVPAEAITLPENPIKGPDMELQNKQFVVTVTINNSEKFNVRCRIHHWSTNEVDRIPYTPNFWEEPTEPVFSEQAELLNSLPPKPKVNKTVKR